MSFTFEQVLAGRRGADFIPPLRLLALDPGHTTGWAVFDDGKLSASGHATTQAGGWKVIWNLFNDVRPDMVIFENYRVYEHKLERHANSEVYTLRLCGVIEFICEVMKGIPYYNQMAHEAKGFVTDKRLEDWGYYKEGYKHARDAIRHGCYFLLFNKELKGGK